MKFGRGPCRRVVANKKKEPAISEFLLQEEEEFCC